MPRRVLWKGQDMLCDISPICVTDQGNQKGSQGPQTVFFFFQFCDSTKVVIIHMKAKPNLGIN